MADILEKNKPVLKQMLSDNPLFTANIESNAMELTITYQLKNTSRQAIYLFDRLWTNKSDGSYEPYEHTAYACVDAKKELHLLVGILPVPKSMSVEVRMIPFVTKIEPGQNYTGTVRLPIPVEENNYYFPKSEKTQFTENNISKIRLTLNFLSMDGITETPGPFDGTFNVRHPALMANIRSVNCTSDIETKVNVRNDLFEPF